MIASLELYTFFVSASLANYLVTMFLLCLLYSNKPVPSSQFLNDNSYNNNHNNNIKQNNMST